MLILILGLGSHGLVIFDPGIVSVVGQKTHPIIIYLFPLLRVNIGIQNGLVIIREKVHKVIGVTKEGLGAKEEGGEP